MFALAPLLLMLFLTVLRVMCRINSQADCPFVFCCCVLLRDLFEPAICWCWLFLCVCNAEACKIYKTMGLCIFFFFPYVWHSQGCLAKDMLWVFFFSVISLWSFILRFSTLFYLGVTLSKCRAGLSMHTIMLPS